MLDEATTEGATPGPRCNWCSASLPSDHETVCPSCGATLLGDGDTTVPGLTAIDAEAILRNARAVKAKPRSRLLGWISGDYDDDSTSGAAAPGSLSPPPADVQREMLRLQLEAQLANAQAEVGAMRADDAVEEGRSLADAPTDAAATAADSDTEVPAGAAASAADESTDQADEAPPA